MTTPVGTHEPRHVRDIIEGDLVWDTALTRWRRVTSVLHYTADRSKQPMVKIVLDISAYHRHVAGDDVHYDVLLDETPAPSVRPMTATERRNAARRGVRDDDKPSSGSTDAAATEAADVPVGAPPADPAVRVTEAPAERRAVDPRPTDQVTEVRSRREALRLSRQAFAELCGLTPGALWRVEEGRPKSDELPRVIAALDAEEAHRATR